ncbi:MAG: flagellar hook-associated protein FlgL [Halanaerobiaceae bacterium]
MRVTNNVMNKNMMKNLSRNMEDLDDLNQRLSSGKKFQYPSESPIEAAHSLQFDAQISGNEQFQKNIDHAENWLKSTESSLKDAGEIMQRGRELAVYGANGSMTAEDRQSLAKEVKELKEELANVGNSKLGDRYLFSGQRTSTKPFTKNASDKFEFGGDYNEIIREVNPDIKMSINVNGQKALGDGIAALEKLEEGLQNNDQAKIDETIGDLDEASNQNIQYRAEAGAKMNRLELTLNRLKDDGVNLEKLKSKNEDADMAETITDLKMKESTYRAALATGARIIQPSLVDFLN